MIFTGRTLLFVALGCGIALVPATGLRAQQSASPSAQAAPSGQDQEPDPLKRQRSDEDVSKAQKAVRQELKGAFKTWLEQDVTYIISDEERKSFKSLSNDEERESFIENSGCAAIPTPTPLTTSSARSTTGAFSMRMTTTRPVNLGGRPTAGTSTLRSVRRIRSKRIPRAARINARWMREAAKPPRSRLKPGTIAILQGIGDNIDLEFVDTCQCGDYHFTIDRGEKDALAHVPGMGATQWEQMGQAKKADRFKGGFETLGTGPLASSQQAKQFDRIELAAKIFAPPPIKFKDLESFITEHKLISGPIFPFDVRTDFVRVTSSTVLVPITLQIKNRDMTFVTKDGVSKGVVNILGKVTTLTHKTVQTFEDTVEVQQPAELLEKSLDRKSIYWKAIPLLPGLYRLDIAIKDVSNPDHIGIYGRGLDVPDLSRRETGDLFSNSC